MNGTLGRLRNSPFGLKQYSPNSPNHFAQARRLRGDGQVNKRVNSRKRECSLSKRECRRVAPTLWALGFEVCLYHPPLTPPVTMASCREAEGRRKLSERSEFFRRLHDGSGAGVSAEAGRAFFGYLSLHEQRKVTRCRAPPANGIDRTRSGISFRQRRNSFGLHESPDCVSLHPGYSLREATLPGSRPNPPR